MVAHRRLFAVMAAAVGACSLFTPLDDLRSDGGTVDADADAPSSDGGTDAPGSDAEPDVATSAFCASVDASNVLFCDDFDESDAAFFPNWTPHTCVTDAGGSCGSLVRDGTMFLSPPYALLAMTPAAAGGPLESAYLQRAFPSSPTRITYTFDVRIGSSDTQGHEALINQIAVYAGASSYTEYRIGVTQAITRFSVAMRPDGGTSSFTFASAWQPGAWHHVVMDLNVAATPATATITVDGNVEVGPDAAVPVATLGANGQLQVLAGIYSSASPQSGWSFDVDNTLVQTQ